MRFKLDENLPTELIADLTQAGHEADTVFQENLAGAHDVDVLNSCHTQGRVLLTLDKGIADIRAYPPEVLAGVVLFRTRSRGRGQVATFVRSRLPDVLKLASPGKLLVVTKSGIRLR